MVPDIVGVQNGIIIVHHQVEEFLMNQADLREPWRKSAFDELCL